MTMAVTERTREIGVMKAIGADPKLIQRLFLMESAWIGIVGTVLAIAISYVVSAVSNYVLPIIVSSALGEEDFGDMTVTFSVIPWQLVLIASAISISVAPRPAADVDARDASGRRGRRRPHQALAGQHVEDVAREVIPGVRQLRRRCRGRRRKRAGPRSERRWICTRPRPRCVSES